MEYEVVRDMIRDVANGHSHGSMKKPKLNTFSLRSFGLWML